MISKIWKFIKGIKDWLDLIIKIVAVIGILTGFAGIKSCNKQKKEKAEIFGILTSKVESYKTKAGLNATKAENWIVKAKSLEKINGEISHENTQIKNDLIEARQTIEDAEIREKDVQHYIKTELVARDSLETSIIFVDAPCRFKIEPIEKEFLSLTFKQNENYELLDIDYKSRNSIYTMVNLYPARIDNPKRKRDGEKHFPNWSVLWGWDHTTITTVKDPNSKITNVVSIEFSK